MGSHGHVRILRVTCEGDEHSSSHIREACNTLRTQAKPKITQVLQEIKDRTGHVLPYDTVRRRFLGISLSPSEAHAHQQLLSPAVEKVLVDWIVFLSDTSHPLNKRSIRKKAEALCGRKPSESWIRAFLGRHPEVTLGRPSGLDPKRAQCEEPTDGSFGGTGRGLKATNLR